MCVFIRKTPVNLLNVRVDRFLHLSGNICVRVEKHFFVERVIYTEIPEYICDFLCVHGDCSDPTNGKQPVNKHVFNRDTLNTAS